MQQASYGHPFVGPMFVAAMLVFHLVFTRPFLPEVIVIASVTAVCTLIDSLYIDLGMLAFKSGYEHLPYIAPPWMSAIWVLYAMCLNHSLVWMNRFILPAAILGSFVAVACYKGGVEIGIVDFLISQKIGLAIIGIVWLFLFPLSLKFSRFVLGKYQNST